jgi:hypothetical protein
VFVKAEAEDGDVNPGEEIGIGGSGFPPDALITIGFRDGGAPFATTQSSSNGTFLDTITVPVRVRIGPRQLVASAPGGVVASFDLTVLGGTDPSAPILPGYGMG